MFEVRTHVHILAAVSATALSLGSNSFNWLPWEPITAHIWVGFSQMYNIPGTEHCSFCHILQEMELKPHYNIKFQKLTFSPSKRISVRI